MNGLDELYQVLEVIENKKQDGDCSPIPIFSFEGLPGAGKTTQIKSVSQKMTHEFGKSCYIDLPTKSSIGRLLKALYLSEEQWNNIRRLNPWLNPVMLSIDLRMAVEEAVREGAKYAFMSRGIISTYYYNLDAYGENEKTTWPVMENHMSAFYKPTAIVFIDVPEELAFERVVKRNRGPLRKMDQIDQMRQDKGRFEKYLERLPTIPVHHIDGQGKVEDITNRIVEELKRYFA
jgi:dTMP kinase